MCPLTAAVSSLLLLCRPPKVKTHSTNSRHILAWHEHFGDVRTVGGLLTDDTQFGILTSLLRLSDAGSPYTYPVGPPLMLVLTLGYGVLPLYNNQAHVGPDEGILLAP